MSSLYILEIKILSEVSFANIFSHMVGSLFILLMFSLAMQKLFILMKSHLFILSFMSLALGHNKHILKLILNVVMHSMNSIHDVKFDLIVDNKRIWCLPYFLLNYCEL